MADRDALHAAYRTTLSAHCMIIDVSKRDAYYIRPEGKLYAKYHPVRTWTDHLIETGDHVAMERITVRGSKRTMTLADYATEREQTAA